MMSLSFGFHCGSSTNCLPQSRHLWFCFPLRVVPFFIMSSDPQVGQLRSSFIQSFLCRDRRSIILFFSALYKKALPIKEIPGLVSKSAILELGWRQSKLREYFKHLRKRTSLLLAGTAVRVWDWQSPRNSVRWCGEILVGRASCEKGQFLL